MIYDTIGAITRYKGLDPRLDLAIDFIASHNVRELPLGRVELDGTAVYYTISRGDLRDVNEAQWEAHDKYLDLQLGLDDGESIDCLPVETLSGWGEWLDNDIRFTPDPKVGVRLPLNQGCFAILFPQDAHKPGIGVGKGHKAVFKVQIKD